MNTNYTRGLSVLGLLLALTARTQANDIVDFLRAVNGAPEQRHTPPAHHAAGRHDHDHYGDYRSGYGGHELSSRDVYKQSMQRAERNAPYGQYGNHAGYDQFDQDQYGRDRLGRNQFDMHNRVDLRDRSYGGSGYSRPDYSRPGYGRPGYNGSGAPISFRVSSNGGSSPADREPLYIPSQQPQALPPVDSYPPVQNYPPVQSYPPVQVLPHQIGEIVDCRVLLATSVRIEDECNIAPNAVPVVVAVRDPTMCAHEALERLVYVQILVPRCPLRGLAISPCRTRITMDYCHYQVDIKSRDGVIVVDYDN